jgi:hypothetical protein
MSTEMHQLAQQAFDKAWQRFVVEGAPQSLGFNSEGDARCAYRGVNGARCAIGLLIDDRDYQPEMEGRTANNLHHVGSLYHSPLVIAAVSICDDDGYSLADRLQTAHDDQHARIRDELTEVAAQFSLAVPKS